MNALTALAQATSTTRLDESSAIIITGITLFFVLVSFIISYVVTAIFLGKIFQKAGLAGWPAWVPFYNTWKLLEIGGQQGFWVVLSIIPPLNIVTAVFTYIAMYHIGKKLGKPGSFVLWAIFLPIVWLIWLAVDTSKWNDQASDAPSRAIFPAVPNSKTA